MKKQFLISIFCFSFLLCKAQFKNDRIILPAFTYSSHSNLKFSVDRYYGISPYSQNSNYGICIKSQIPQLPFFCDMEEKFRSKFSFFLKLRAGNDESYMRMISPKNRD